jgi:hypothetical protein
VDVSEPPGSPLLGRRHATREPTSRGAGATYMTHSVGGAPARFEDVPPASYSLCVVAIFSDLQDPRAVQRVQRQAALLPAACVPFQVTDTAGPEQQSTVLL